MDRPLDGKAAIIVGGSRGIGAAIVRRLARDGAAVAFTYARSAQKAYMLAEEIRSASGRALAIQADSADPAAIREAFERTEGLLGHVDILVNNAGIIMHGLIEDMSVDDFDRIVAVNVRAAFIAAQEGAKRMSEGGRIIFIGSIAGERAGFAGSSFYVMTKSAIAGLTRGIARDLAPRGITVNNVQPGPTATDMTPGEGDIADKVRPLIPLGRLGNAEETASLVAYLAGPQSSFITGASLTIDGGYLA